MHIVQLYLLLFFCNAYIHAAHMVSAQIQCHVGKSDLLEIGIDFFTLGIFYLIVNTALLYLAAWLANGLFGIGFWISGFGSAFLASIVISIVTAIVNAIVASDNRPTGGY